MLGLFVSSPSAFADITAGDDSPTASIRYDQDPNARTELANDSPVVIRTRTELGQPMPLGRNKRATSVEIIVSEIGNFVTPQEAFRQLQGSEEIREARRSGRKVDSEIIIFNPEPETRPLLRHSLSGSFGREHFADQMGFRADSISVFESLDEIQSRMPNEYGSSIREILRKAEVPDGSIVVVGKALGRGQDIIATGPRTRLYATVVRFFGTGGLVHQAMVISTKFTASASMLLFPSVFQALSSGGQMLFNNELLDWWKNSTNRATRALKESAILLPTLVIVKVLQKYAEYENVREALSLSNYSQTELIGLVVTGLVGLGAKHLMNDYLLWKRDRLISDYEDAREKEIGRIRDEVRAETGEDNLDKVRDIFLNDPKRVSPEVARGRNFANIVEFGRAMSQSLLENFALVAGTTAIFTEFHGAILAIGATGKLVHLYGTGDLKNFVNNVRDCISRGVHWTPRPAPEYRSALEEVLWTRHPTNRLVPQEPRGPLARAGLIRNLVIDAAYTRSAAFGLQWIDRYEWARDFTYETGDLSRNVRARAEELREAVLLRLNQPPVENGTMTVFLLDQLRQKFRGPMVLATELATRPIETLRATRETFREFRQRLWDSAVEQARRTREFVTTIHHRAVLNWLPPTGDAERNLESLLRTEYEIEVRAEEMRYTDIVRLGDPLEARDWLEENPGARESFELVPTRNARGGLFCRGLYAF